MHSPLDHHEPMNFQQKTETENSSQENSKESETKPIRRSIVKVKRNYQIYKDFSPIHLLSKKSVQLKP